MVNTGRSRPHFSSLLAALSCASAPAWADEPEPPVAMDFVCDGLHRTQVLVDGIQSDWEDEAGPAERVAQMVEGAWRYDYTGPVDASFRIWCRYTDNALYFAVVGRDNHVVEARGGRPGDRFELWLQTPGDAGEPIGVVLDLGDLEGGVVTPRWAEGSGRSGEVRAARAEVSPRETGYFIEVGIPYTADPALSEPFAPRRFYAAHRDWDHDTDGEREVVVGSAPAQRDDPETWGKLSFTGPDALVRQVARERGVDPADAVGRVFGDVGGSSTQEYCFVLDGHLFAAGTGLGDFTWTSILVAPSEAHTPLALELADLDGDGDLEILYRSARERRSIDLGGTVVQEFVTAFDLQGRELAPLFGQEVAFRREDGAGFEMEYEVRPGRSGTTVRFTRPRTGGIEPAQWIALDEDPEWTPALTPWSEYRRIEHARREDGTWGVTITRE